MDRDNDRTTRHDQSPVPLDDDARWQAVRDRDRRGDGRFVFAVRSTGIYCRPSCPARRPHRANVRFFATAAEAEHGGFRPCRRCRPEDAAAPEAEVVRQVCRYIEEHPYDRVTLAALGAHVGLSPSHLQRLFKAAIGITPRQYAEARRLDRFKTELKEGDAVSGALYGAGYRSSSQLYTQAPARLGMTPTTYRKGGIGMDITYTTMSSPLGWLLVAGTERGLCTVRFGASTAALEQTLQHEFPTATIRRDDAALRPWVDAVARYVDGRQPGLDLPLDVQATAFQSRVYEALGPSPTGARARTARWRGLSANRRPRGRWRKPAPATPWPWSSPATVSCGTTATWAATAGAWSASAPCSRARPRPPRRPTPARRGTPPSP